MMSATPISLKARALRLLSGREHSRAELERKLASHEVEPGSLGRALDELASRGFIDEQRVLDSVVHRRAAKFGAARIRQELQGKGLDPEAVRAALAELGNTELDRAREVWRHRFAQAPADAAAYAKQVRFLLSRGFATETVRRVVSHPTGDAADPDAPE